MLRAFGPSLVRAALLLAAASLWVEVELPEPGEALVLRWVRVAVAHPWRSLLALALLDCAFTLRPARSGVQEGVPDHPKPVPPLVSPQESR